MLVFCILYIYIDRYVIMYILSTIVSYCYLHSSIGIFCLVLCDHFHLHIINDFQHLFHTLYVYLWVGDGGRVIIWFWGCGCLFGVGWVGAYPKCTLRHWEGMCSQRCSSPQHSTNLYICWSSRDIRACFTSSSQVMWISHLNKSNKDVYCIEILYKYDHTIYSMI